MFPQKPNIHETKRRCGVQHLTDSLNRALPPKNTSLAPVLPAAFITPTFGLACVPEQEHPIVKHHLHVSLSVSVRGPAGHRQEVKRIVGEVRRIVGSVFLSHSVPTGTKETADADHFFSATCPLAHDFIN